MSRLAKQAADQIRASGLAVLLAVARQKVEQENGVRGNLVLTCTSEQQARLADLVGHKNVKVRSGAEILISLRQLDERLRASWAEVGLWDVLEADGGPIVIREERERTARQLWADQLDRIASVTCLGQWGQEWVNSLSNSDGMSGRRYRRAYNEDPYQAERAAIAVVRALTTLPLATSELLAVFAARVTGDPHAFDPKKLAGRLLLAAIEEKFGSTPLELRDTEERAILLGHVNLEVDGLSSTVLVANLGGTNNPVLDTMATAGEGWPVPLHAIRDLRFENRTRLSVYIVENPQVFDFLARALRDMPISKRPPLLCTGGFLSAAALRLLDRLHEAGCRLKYGGDFDRNGLLIAKGLLARYSQLGLWRMDPSDYTKALDADLDERFIDSELAWLGRQMGEIQATAEAMVKSGKPAYQERLVMALLGDLRQAMKHDKVDSCSVE